VKTDANVEAIEQGMAYLFNIGLSLCAVVSLCLCIPALFTIILRREKGTRGSGGSRNCKSHVVQWRQHHVQWWCKMNHGKSGLDRQYVCWGDFRGGEKDSGGGGGERWRVGGRVEKWCSLAKD